MPPKPSTWSNRVTDIRRWRGIGIVVGFVLSAFAMGVVLASVDLLEVAEALRLADLRWLLATIPLKALAFSFLAVRSRILMRPVTSLSFGRAWRSHLMSFVGNNVLPFRAGEIVRVLWLSRRQLAPAEAVLSAAALERLLDLSVLLGVFVLAAPSMAIEVPPGLGLYGIVVVLMTIILGSVLVSLRPTWFVAGVRLSTSWAGDRLQEAISGRARRFAEGLAGLSSPLVVVGAVGATVAYWCVSLLGVWCWLQAFGLQLGWEAPLVISAYLAFGTVLPSAPGFVGTYHLAATGALIMLGVAAPVAVSVAVAGHFFAFAPWTVGGAPFVARDLWRVWRERA